jgi:predicted enzyme related to lactoylglutathione lyase
MADVAPPPHGSVAHFAINADDLDAAIAFYTTLFGWGFTPWGPPGFYQIDRPTAPVMRAALAWLEDPAGNAVGVMQYAPDRGRTRDEAAAVVAP